MILNQKDVENWLREAYKQAQLSKDPSTQVGAILVADNGTGLIFAVAHNQFPDGVDENVADRWERPLKYSYICHAEAGCIFMAAKNGYPTRGSVMVAPWAACTSCAKAIVQAGVKTLVRHKQAMEAGNSSSWQKEIDIADAILKEAGVRIVEVDATDLCSNNIRMNGQNWKP